MFVVNEDSLVADEYIASIILSLLVTFVFAIFIRFHLNVWVVLLQFLLCASGFMYKCIPSVWTLVLAGVTMVGILLAGNIKGRITKDMYAGMLVFAGVLAGAACLIFILLTYIPIPVVDDIKDSIVYNGGNLIYGKMIIRRDRSNGFIQLKQMEAKTPYRDVRACCDVSSRLCRFQIHGRRLDRKR